MIHSILKKAKACAVKAACLTADEKNCALLHMAEALITATPEILAENAKDVEAATHLSSVMKDRLLLTEARIAAMAEGLRQVAKLPDPVGTVLEEHFHPNGMKIQKVSVPFGVVAVIFESRPNVAADSAALTLKSGNVCVLRGGKESFLSCSAIVAALRRGLLAASLPEDLVQMVTDRSRESATVLMTAKGLVDLLIPRGGKGLIQACVENATVPCIETGTGICHIYVDESADFNKALAIVKNAKTSRPSVCNAAEVCLVHAAIAPRLLPLLRKALVEDRIAEGQRPVSLLLSPEAAAIIDGETAKEDDFDTEFLDYKMAIKVVSGVEEAIAHISEHSTHHSEAIITESAQNAALFTKVIDSAAVYVNASTRFTDGGEFGLGAEIGISTQKLHARGPMGIRELTTYKYIVNGDGQIR